MMLSAGRNGNLSAYRGVARHRVAAEDNLARRPRRSRRQQEAECFVVTDPDGLVRYLDPLAEAMFHRRGDTLVGQAFAYRVLDGVRSEIEITRPDGTSFRAEMQVVGTEWEGEAAYLISLHGLDGRKR